MLVLPAKLCVIAAHPDDDTIGCGGLMARVAAAGGEVLVAYLTDGSRSHPGSHKFPPASVAVLRAREARAALDILGIRQVPLFFEIVDGTLANVAGVARRDAIERLTRAIDAFAPTLVVAPWKRDPHPDHTAAASICAEAVASLAIRTPLLGYEVWLPIRGSRADHPQPGETTTQEIGLDPATLERKRRAILAHRTQTTAIIDDDPMGFHIDEALLQRWLGTTERFHTMQSRPPQR